MDAEVDRLRLELVNVENGLDAVIDELRERGRSPALSAALVESEARKDEVEARLVEAVARQARASPASQERRRADLAAHLGAPAGVLNVKLRAVFGARLAGLEGWKGPV